MSSIQDQPAGPAEHPAWCSRQHNPGYPVHTADVGDQDIEVSQDRSLSVSLFQRGTDPAQVWLCEHNARNDETTVIPLTAAQAEQLGRRLLEAAGTSANFSEVRSVRETVLRPLGPGLS